jgi:hypothetical protein
MVASTLSYVDPSIVIFLSPLLCTTVLHILLFAQLLEWAGIDELPGTANKTCELDVTVRTSLHEGKPADALIIIGLSHTSAFLRSSEL